MQDATSLLLRVAEINEDLVFAASHGNCDINAMEGTAPLMESKLRRSGVDFSGDAAFSGLLELAGVPDVGAPFSSGAVPFSELWNLRRSVASKAFRRWLREADSSDADALKTAYVRALQEVHWSDRLPFRALRFVATSLAGLTGLGVGTAADVADSFFIDRWIRGSPPSLFMNQLQRLVEEDRR